MTTLILGNLVVGLVTVLLFLATLRLTRVAS